MKTNMEWTCRNCRFQKRGFNKRPCMHGCYTLRYSGWCNEFKPKLHLVIASLLNLPKKDS